MEVPAATQADHDELDNVRRDHSGNSSNLTGDFMKSDPKFDSHPSSSSDSELADMLPTPPLVTVVWRQLTVVSLIYS